MTMRAALAGRRLVVHGDAFEWLDANGAPEGASIVTSLPDHSELPELGLTAWREWFMATVARLVAWLPERGAAVFYQSDVRHQGAWIDKGHLVLSGGERAGASVAWHKIVCRKPPGTLSMGRPTYSHMIALSKTPLGPARHAGPDVLEDAGAMDWSRAMGLNACRVACVYLRDDVGARVIVDPFCGRGSVLAAANALGLDAIGVEKSGKRCRAARAYDANATRSRDDDAADVTEEERDPS